MEKESAQILLTKTFWLPATSWFVTWALAHWQPIVPVTDETAAVAASAMAWVVSIAVRRVTSRSTHFIKPKETPDA